MKAFKIQNENYKVLIISIIVFLIVILSSKFLYIFDKNIQKFYMDLKSTNYSKVSDDILVVEIDEKTLEKLWIFPFDRSHYANVIKNLTQENISVIWFDLFFSEKSNDESDRIFSDSIKDSWKVIFGLPITSYWFPQKSYSLFDDYLLSSWYVRPNLDKATQSAFSFTPFSRFEDWNIHEHFSILLLKAYYSNIYEKDYLSGKWTYESLNYSLTDNIKIPFSEKWSKDILINYLPFTNSDLDKKDDLIVKTNNSFNKLSFLDLYYEDSFDKLKEKYDFENKIVIIWTTAKWLNDTFSTPVWIIYWVYLHANIINTILTKSYLTYFDKYLELILIFLLIIISTYFNFNKRWYVLLISNILIAFIFLFAFPFYIILETNLIINFPLELFSALVLSLIFSNIVKYLTELKNRQRLNRALSEYVSEDIASEILSWMWKVNLDWEEKRVAVFFSDIEWFTNISEKLSPQNLLLFLREYLRLMSDIILDERWFINKYEWDWIMAMWWAFWKVVDNKSYYACKTALEQQKLLSQINKKFFPIINFKINVRIWIHLWDVVVWNIWSKWRKMEFTALWDTVNLASRLEWVNKYFYTKIMVSEEVYEENKDFFIFRCLWKIKVKWKDNPTFVYELLDYKDSEKNYDFVGDFELALDCYFKKDFDESLKIFERLYNSWDKVSLVYINECKSLKDSLLWDNWDWVISLLQK